METDQAVASSRQPEADDLVVRRLLQQAHGLTRDLERVRERVDCSPFAEAGVADLDARAIKEIDGAQSSVVMVATVSLAETTSRTAIARGLVMAAGRGVQVTLLLSPHDLKQPDTARTLDRMRNSGVHVRIAMHAPSITLLVVDRNLAMIRPIEDGHLGLVVKGTPVCAALAQLAHAYWSRSYAPQGHSADRSPTRLTLHQRNQILALLVSGDKDEVAARVLGVSLRTYRRYVRQLMDELGANSRFEAGFLAAERGWHTPLGARRRPS